MVLHKHEKILRNIIRFLMRVIDTLIVQFKYIIMCVFLKVHLF